MNKEGTYWFNLQLEDVAIAVLFQKLLTSRKLDYVKGVTLYLTGKCKQGNERRGMDLL